ncbi:GNAT family N-acetyltransferase [Halobacillus salinus]|uniref:GNAT family N-acetyltransferase n=1 Tax=Halobacillus salinus TaxID=192814 RepID=UPI0009A8DF4A|nr:GNAT family protein [Halobacillus salinus]
MIDLSRKPVLKGNKTILRPFKEEDLPAIEECLQDPEVLKLTGSADDFDKELVREWYITRNEQTDRLDLAIVDAKHNVVVGEAVANLYDQETESMNFRILIGPRGRDKGLGTEATQLMVDYLFTNTSLQQLTLSVFDFNPRAKRVYEKVGFVKYSVDKDDLEFEGEWIDSINMKLVKEDWLRNKRD